MSPLPSTRTFRYWGRRGGSVAKDGTLAFKIKRGSNTSTSSSGAGKRHYTALLAANAKAKGWLNGERLKQGGIRHA